MHLAEALLTLDEAVALAREVLAGGLVRNARYYERVPGLRPDPARPLPVRCRAADAWWWVAFARTDPAQDPYFVRVNAMTRQASPEKGL
jgi:hypothetical protein